MPALCCHRGPIAGPRAAGLVSHPALRRSFLVDSQSSYFCEVLAGLRATLPPAMPVVVRTSWLPETILGQCFRRMSRFVIRLNNRMGDEQAVDVLCHEWAHALAWNFSLDRLTETPGLDPAEFDRASHDEAWGCAYSRVWRAYLDITRTAA
jgi:hypothetical protein